jgi:RNA polymerase sigma-70 factor (ECF subfamily)
MATQERLLNSSLFADLVALWRGQDGRRGAFVRLYDEYFPRVYNYIRYRCGDAATADDLTAQTFERALQHIEQYDPERAPFGAWLFAIARSVVSNHLRSEIRRGWLPLEACERRADQETGPEDRVIQVETQAELLAAFSFLSERERDLLSLKFAAHLTNRRIAEITGLTEANVGVILYRALHRLRVIMGEGQAEHG